MYKGYGQLGDWDSKMAVMVKVNNATTIEEPKRVYGFPISLRIPIIASDLDLERVPGIWGWGPISLGIWGSGSPKNWGPHFTVTPVGGCVLSEGA
jgi:hypothetical protein